MQTTPDEVLEFWLGPEAERDTPSKEVSSRWWKKDPAFDAEIRRRFEPAMAAAGNRELDSWTRSPRGRLAIVVLLDQFTRNVYRNSGRMFENDAYAQSLVLDAVAAGEDTQLRSAERYFLYMPLMHAEDLELQDRAVTLFERLAADAPKHADGLKYAKAHRDIIARFGRFPHRNEWLGRQSTPEELEFLKQPGSSF